MDKLYVALRGAKRTNEIKYDNWIGILRTGVVDVMRVGNPGYEPRDVSSLDVILGKPGVPVLRLQEDGTVGVLACIPEPNKNLGVAYWCEPTLPIIGLTKKDYVALAQRLAE
tara:strand:- start:10958 stop:11293 length:336 start_codon:yes stop_codon:yes gene_type:complete